MNNFLFFVVAAPVWLAISAAAMAQSAIYRCGNEYLNDAAVAVARGCQMIEGGNVTVVPGTHVNRVDKEPASSAGTNVPARSLRRSTGTRPSTDVAAQRARDSDARSILLAELTTAQARLAEQQQAYNNGAPEKRAIDTQHPQRYQERVNELKDGIQRYTGDIAGLKREIARLPAITTMPR